MIRIVMLAVATTMLVTTMLVGNASAQGRGRGHDRGSWGWNKKCEKFVNCHDARDGRWDNRGPRRRLNLGNRYYSPYVRTRVYDGRARRVYGDRLYVRSRRHW